VSDQFSRHLGRLDEALPFGASQRMRNFDREDIGDKEFVQLLAKAIADGEGFGREQKEDILDSLTSQQHQLGQPRQVRHLPEQTCRALGRPIWLWDRS
jgi:hypothetical protein